MARAARELPDEGIVDSKALLGGPPRGPSSRWGQGRAGVLAGQGAARSPCQGFRISGLRSRGLVEPDAVLEVAGPAQPISRYAPGGTPISRLKARLKDASEA